MNSEEKKTEAEVTVTLSDPEQEQEEEKDPMEMNVEEENEQDSFSPTPGAACASKACISDPRSILTPTFWIPVHIVILERPTKCAVFNVITDSPRDPIQFIEWSPTCCPCALLITNFHGRVTIWTQPSQGPANFVLDTSCWLCEHKWRQEISVATKWLSAVSPHGKLSSKSSAPANSKSMFEEKFILQQSQTSASWPNFFVSVMYCHQA
ncbi:unnamed protein product [Vicia faba]|uniref:Uncharacterized protein n=1 Tax=Vicia faba TaxID=3906 RepID=A0AAV0ZKG0_VICFA|nr:unnamed protein product [Vicia faba]